MLPLDMLRPNWKNSSKDARIAAVKDMKTATEKEMLDILEAIVSQDKEPSVRLEAIKRISDIDLLKRIVTTDEDGTIRREALSNLYYRLSSYSTAYTEVFNQNFFWGVVVNDKDKIVRESALAKIVDPKILLKLLSENIDADIYSLATQKLKTLEMIKNVKDKKELLGIVREFIKAKGENWEWTYRICKWKSIVEYLNQEVADNILGLVDANLSSLIQCDIAIDEMSQDACKEPILSSKPFGSLNTLEERLPGNQFTKTNGGYNPALEIFRDILNDRFFGNINPSLDKEEFPFALKASIEWVTNSHLNTWLQDIKKYAPERYSKDLFALDVIMFVNEHLNLVPPMKREQLSGILRMMYVRLGTGR
jgi:hypothetical protein